MRGDDPWDILTEIAAAGCVVTVKTNAGSTGFMALYSSPDVFDEVLGNLVPSFNVPMDFIKAVKAVGALPFTEKKDAGKKAVKKVFRAIPIVNLIPKLQYMSERDISTIAR